MAAGGAREEERNVSTSCRWVFAVVLLGAGCTDRGTGGGGGGGGGGEDAAAGDDAGGDGDAGGEDPGGEDAGTEDGAPAAGPAADGGPEDGGGEAPDPGPEPAEDCEPAGPPVTLLVPDVCPTIQAALDAARDGDRVLVRAGTYNEQLMVPARRITVMSDLVDYAGTFPDKSGQPVEIRTRKQVLRRTLRTVIEGTGFPGGADARPMVDFADGTTRETVFDGFTVQFLPSTDHTIPGHAHTVECRGTSPTIRNNIVRFNGSTGVGSHATFRDREDGRMVDWRQSNLESIPAPLVEDNISHHNEGMGLGNNHYSQAHMRNNEVFANATLELDHSAAGIGARHGARPVIEGNIVYGNAWGGITVRQGVQQGRHPIDLRTSAVIRNNEVYDNGLPGAPQENIVGIGVDGAGTEEDPVVVEGNIVHHSKTTGIGIRNVMSGDGYAGTDTWLEVSGNVVYASGSAGIGCTSSSLGTTHCEVGHNVVYDSGVAGIVFGGREHPDNATGLVWHNTVVRSGTAGLQAGPAAVDVRNNIFYANTGPGMQHPDGPHDHNLLSGNRGQPVDCAGQGFCVNPQYAPGSGGQGQGAGDVWTDPRFADPDNGDFHLLEGSPAIDAGADLGKPFSGAAPDMGALQWEG